MSNMVEGSILVLVDHEVDSQEPTLTNASSKVLRLARTLTDKAVYALSLAANPDRDALAQAGADVVLVARTADETPFCSQVPAVVTDAALAAARHIDADLSAILCVSTYNGRAVAAMLGARLQSGASVEVSDLSVETGEGGEATLVARKSVLGGAWSTTFRIGGSIPIIAIAVGSGVDDAVRPGDAVVEPLVFTLSRGAAAVHVEESKPVDAGARINLSEAAVAVIAGRGVDGDMELVEGLADALGAGIGATRVACDEGWIGRAAQVGQTGVSISPKLYVGLGVSGAVHHTCGMLASEKIVAVTDDPDAPIVELADFTVIGDVADVIPQALDVLSQAAKAADA